MHFLRVLEPSERKEEGEKKQDREKKRGKKERGDGFIERELGERKKKRKRGICLLRYFSSSSCPVLLRVLL